MFDWNIYTLSNLNKTSDADASVSWALFSAQSLVNIIAIAFLTRTVYSSFPLRDTLRYFSMAVGQSQATLLVLKTLTTLLASVAVRLDESTAYMF